MAKKWELGEVCYHGGLGRKCEICGRDEVIQDLYVKISALQALVDEAALLITDLLADKVDEGDGIWLGHSNQIKLENLQIKIHEARRG